MVSSYEDSAASHSKLTVVSLDLYEKLPNRTTLWFEQGEPVPSWRLATMHDERLTYREIQGLDTNSLTGC